ncbi:endoribonuclease L-PSP [Thalassospira profundimaris]|uniref:Endoribonuclease L-PSP n=1 Tax=Thalassospira profundimaris TaxID=502049 RepID=A0A367XJR9_9PROT|nr:RidA family protein [Thalassospira profundimaris]RCK53865.1 endoribonuclease L-PSP [Thalassospira profundimaris]
MKMTPKNPRNDIYPATPDYVHAMEVTGAARFLFVSGTMGLDIDGTAPDGLDDQLSLIWSNIRRILAEADMTTENIVRVTSYLSDVTFVQPNQDARLQALGERRVPTTAIVVQTLKPEWLVEIEIVAAA